MVYFSCCKKRVFEVLLKIIWKGEYKVNRKKISTERKSTFIKIAFLLSLLICAAFMYMESRLLIDVAYFAVVAVIFIRFIIVKLYH